MSFKTGKKKMFLGRELIWSSLNDGKCCILGLYFDIIYKTYRKHHDPNFRCNKCRCTKQWVMRVGLASFQNISYHDMSQDFVTTILTLTLRDYMGLDENL